MSRESVRYGRVPKKAKEEEEREEGEEQRKSHLLSTLCSSIRSAHLEHCPTPLCPLLRPLVAEGSGDSARLDLFHKVVTRLTPQIQGVVEFAKRIPGFNILPTDDQLVLVKHGVMEAWLVGVSITKATPSLPIVWEDGTYIDKEQVETLYGTKMTDELWEARERLAGIGRDEACLLASLALLDGSRPGIVDTAAVDTSHAEIMEGLQQVTLEVGRQRMSSRLVEELGRMKEVAVMHGEALGWFRERTNKVPPLFAEIFDFSKEEGMF